MSGQFNHSLFSCFDNFGLCIITTFVPCYTAGKNAEALGDSCLVWALINMVCPLAHALTRQKTREAKGIEGSLLSDLLVTCCCECCSVIQVSRELSDGGAAGQSMERA